ncbi:MAG: LysM peptidoglycan-binding domain-containing protein [Chloroflexi bacterium]|nr:LysM peptidoglycan-binding domain-containing protein [Chloroflexota bacterium]
MRRYELTWKFGAIAAAIGVVVGAACSDSNDSNTPTPAPTTPAPSATAARSATPNPTPTATPSPVATASPSGAARIATTAGYFLYVTRSGDTGISVAGYFNGEPGTAKAGFPQQILDVNGITGQNLPPGQEIAIPLIRTGRDIIPGAGITLTLQQAGSKLALLEPGAAILAAYQDRVVLHKVELAGADGYRMEYWLADSTITTADGGFNRDAKVTTPLLVIGAGSLAAAQSSSDTTAFERGGQRYSVGALAGATTSATDLAAQLQVAPAGP